MCIRNAQNMAESDFREKFFPAENAGNIPEIAVFAHFPQTFTLHFVVFHTKTLMISLFSFVRSFVRFSGSYPLMSKFALSFLTFIIR